MSSHFPEPTAASAASRGTTPVRTCIGCRRRSPASALIRVVACAGVLTPDSRGGLPGRGAHVHPDTACADAAKRGWARALKAAGPFDDSLVRGAIRQMMSQMQDGATTESMFDHESAGESE